MSQFNLPGSSTTYDLLVTNTGNRADTYVVIPGAYEWVVNVQDSIGPVPRGQTAILPVTVNIPEDAEDWQSDTVLIRVASQADPFQTDESQITTVARKYGVAFTPPFSSIEALQGTTVTYTLQINNTGGYNDTYSVTVDAQWNTEITPTIVGPLDPGQSADITVAVEIPSGLPGGTYDEAILTAKSWGDPDQSGQALLRTIGNVFGLIVRPAYEEQVALPGSTVTYHLMITNTSNLSDTYDITQGSHAWPVMLSASTIGPLDDHGGTAPLTVTVVIPPAAPDWESDSVVITVTSQIVQSRSAIATLKTTARLFGVNVTPGEMDKDGIPGQKVVYPLTVTNTGGYIDTFTVSGMGGWTIDINPSILGPLDPGASERITVTVEIPVNAGDAVNASIVTVTSWEDPQIFAQSTLSTRSKLYGVVLAPDALTRFGDPGEEVTFELEVTNSSNYADTFTVHVTSDWLTEINPIWIGPIPAHATATLTVIVSIPVDAGTGSTSSAVISVTSQADPARQDIAYLTTIVGRGQLFLPMVQK
jgi:uncharacterized membrane protein